MNGKDLSGLDSNKLQGLLQVVSKKLNIPPQQLEAELRAGKFDSALAGMDAASSARFRQAMQNPQLVDKLMSTPQAKALYEKLTGGK